MSVRAKFRVVSNESVPGNGNSIALDAVYDPDPNGENGQFFRWTPSGQIRMGVVNEAAAAQFEVGKTVYVDFTAADE